MFALFKMANHLHKGRNMLKDITKPLVEAFIKQRDNTHSKNLGSRKLLLISYISITTYCLKKISFVRG